LDSERKAVRYYPLIICWCITGVKLWQPSAELVSAIQVITTHHTISKDSHSADPVVYVVVNPWTSMVCGDRNQSGGMPIRRY